MGSILALYMGGCQNSGLFLGTLNIRCRITMGNLKGTIILTTTHMETVKGRMFGSITQSPIGHL